MVSLTAWIRLAPFFGALAVAAGLVGLIVPDTRSFSVAALAFFGLVMLYAWFMAVRQVDQQTDAVSSLEVKSSQLENEVRRHRDALDDLADGLDQSLFLTTQEQQILYANRRAIDFFGYDDPSGQTLLAVTLSNELSELVKEATKTGEPRRSELTLRQPRERTVLAAVWMESSTQARVFVSLVDITSLRRLERVRRDFVANVSHELRTPMTTIRAMAETIEDELPSDDENKHYLGKIIKEVDRLTRITDDLLSLSVAESAAPTRAKTDFTHIVRNVIQQLSDKAEKKGLHLSYNGPTSCPLFANEEQLTQVVLNLVDNAINYSTKGQIDVRLSADDEDRVILEVQDTGLGIASEHLPRLFERFYRVDKGRSRATGGTGLGLSIVRHIVESHGGRVEVASELNKGSTFIVSLPHRDQTSPDDSV